MKSFKHYLFEASQDLDRDIKKKMAEEAVKVLEQDDFWNSKTSAEKEQAIKDARKKAEEDYDKLSAEDKKKKRKEYKKASKQTQNEKTDKEVDREIKKKLADDAEAETKKAEGFEDESPEYQKQAIEDARKKAEEKYDELSDEDKKKKREEYRKPQNTSTKIDNTNKKQESKKTEDKLKELKNLLAKNKEDLTQNEQKRIEQLKNDPDIDKNDLTKQEIKSLGSESVTDEFLNKLKDVDKSLSERDGVYKQLKSMTPEILTVFALCCPVGALAIGGAITLGLLSSIVIKKCIENKDSKTANVVIDSAMKVADGDEDTLNDLKNIKKSAFIDDSELATDEDFELNLKENGLDKIVKNLKDNKETLDTEVDTEQIQQAIEQVSNNSAEETGEETEEPKKEEEPKKKGIDKVRGEQEKEMDKIQDNFLKESEKLRTDFETKLKSAKSKEEREQLKKEFDENYQKLNEKTQKELKDAGDLGEEFNKTFDEEFKKASEKSSKEMEDFYEKTKDLDPKSEEYNKAKKELDDKIKNIEKERDNAIDSAAEKAWDNKTNKNTNSEEPKKEEEKEKLSNEDIEKIQDEMANLDPEKDKDKIKEMEDQLKAAAKKAGKNESEYLMKTDTDKDGKQRQRKTGPRGGKYYRVKGDNGWGDWISGEPNESLTVFLQKNINNINENKSNNMKLSEYLRESLNDDARELFIKVISEEWDEKLYNKLSKKVGVFTPNNQQLFSFMKGLHTLVKNRVVKENLNLNWIDTSNITSMYMMFKGKKVMFDMTKWNTSNVTNFTECFADAQIYRNTIENWDMSSADALPYMFTGATVNCDLSKWVIDKNNYPRYINIFKNCKIDKKHYPMMKDMDDSIQQMNEYFGLD